MSSETWQGIRALRASPTGAAAHDQDRRQTFTASLRRAEELAEAAHAAGYGAKPLPQFYSLSQAGHAIAAARASANWVLRGHGLRVTTDATTPLLETTGEPIGGGADSFSGVARALGSPLLHGRAALGELWAANPDLLQPLTESPWRSATVCVLGTDVTAALVRMRADVARELPAITRLYLTPVSPTAD